MNAGKQIRKGLAGGSLAALLIIGLVLWQSTVASKPGSATQTPAICCTEHDVALSPRWYVQCDPAAYYTDWQLLM